MEFSTNSPIIFVMVALIIAVVLIQAMFFLVRAWKRAGELGIDKRKLKKTVIGAAVFTIAPAVAIIISVITLSKDLGLALPWLRLSVIGSLSYETTAAINALNGMNLTLGQLAAPLTAKQFVTVAIVMTLSIVAGLILMPLVSKKIQSGLSTLEKRDKTWGEIFSQSLFIGMIAAFLGFIFCDFSHVFSGDLSALIPVLVMLASALITVICGLLMKNKHLKFLGDYALPLSMVGSMLLAIPLTAWLG